MRARVAIWLMGLLAACGGSGGGGPPAGGGPPPAPPAFGLTQRIEVQGVNFPTNLPEPTEVTIVRAFQNLQFNRPVVLTHPTDGTDRIFVVEQAGRIRVFVNDPDTNTSELFLDIRGRVGNNSSEEGLLGLTFHPDYATNGFFYVHYTTGSPRRGRLSRFQVTSDPSVADEDSEQVLLEFSQPRSNHNGGSIAFGPDRKLYMAVGDGGGQRDPDGNGQSLTTLLGKILRVEDDGSVPADNPFAGQGGGVRGEIWAYGFRHPWRLSFDRNTGDLWVGDVGQGDIEEIDLVTRGGNYGWDIYEGTREHQNPDNLPPGDFIAPVHEYTHSDGRAVIGGYVYRGTAVPSLYGAYVYGDYTGDRVWALVYDGNQVISNTEIGSFNNPASFGEDRHGEVYICSLSGDIWKFDDGGAANEPTLPQRLSETGLFIDVVDLEPTPGLIEFDVNSPLWSDGARKRRWMALPGTARITFQETGAWDFPVGTVLVKHFELDLAPGQVQRLETRVLVHHEDGWQGYTYKWNQAQTDADLLADADTETYVVQDDEAPGGQRLQTWYFPSRTDCNSCHTSAAGRVLGIRTRQLNGDFPYEDMTDNQLRAWNHIDLFTNDIGSAVAYETLPDPADETVALADRARSYLAVNCAVCHLPNGPTPVSLDLRYGIPIAQMNTHGVAPDEDLGLPNPFRIDVGSKETSVLWLRLSRLDSLRMPPLGSNVVDGDGLALIGEWIDTHP